MPVPAERHYSILGLVGKGGQGRVYRARLVEGTFEKDVAIKLLHGRPTPLELEEFHEEARVQALLRDRAVVNVEPPVDFDGTWALVMEFVDGMSLRDVCSRHGTLPPTVALELIAEVARVLGKAWELPGPNGEPLHLQHCDIKPANIQITPSGEVRVLDFGAAQRAATMGSGSVTTISGTPGYVAPERLDGELTPTTDIFSLGVTLWKLLTGARGRFQSERDIQDAIEEFGQDPAMRSALQLAVRMRDPYAGRRPMPEEVRAAALGLVRTMSGPDLGEWARTIGNRELEQDEMTGVRLVARQTAASAPPRVAPESSVHSKGTVLGVGLGLVTVLVVVGGGLLGIGGIGLMRLMEAPSEVVAPPGSQLLMIESHPPGAKVWMGETLVGTTPILDMVVKEGTYELKLQKGRFELHEWIDVSADDAHRYQWNITQGDRGLSAR